MTSDERLGDIHNALSRLEAGHLRLDTELAKVKAEMIDLKMSTAAEIIHRTNIEKQLSAIQQTVSWVLRIVFGGFLAAAIAFIINGGLVV